MQILFVLYMTFDLFYKSLVPIVYEIKIQIKKTSQENFNAETSIRFFCRSP